MKLRHLLLIATLATFALLTQSCVSTYTKVTAPDGTITETTNKGPDANSVNAIGGVVGVAGNIYLHKVIAEK